jgi:soluble lytic murein transglycosylase-like protein
MGINLSKLIVFGGLGYLAYKVLTQPSATGTITEQISNFGDDLMNTVSPGAWKTSNNAQIYVPFINSAEMQLGIPQDLLARIAYQESHFRADIVSGSVTSPAGAIGLMQLMPQYFPGAGANWQQDVISAGNELNSLYARFHDWQLAVAAYNWGQGNLNSYLANPGTISMPTETSKYVAEVIADVPISGSLVSV